MVTSRIQNEIVQYIKRNRVSTTEVADCLGKSGALPGVSAVNQGCFAVGRVRYVYGHSSSNWSIHEQIREVQRGEVVVVDGIEVGDRALIGELVVKFLVLYKMAAAVVVPGFVRDANDLLKNRYPVWCRGFSPMGCFNTRQPESEVVRKQVAERKKLYENSIAVCDDTGVVIIPGSCHDREFLKKLHLIEQQEDIWFNCIDFRKWDTFDTVCLKKYLKTKKPLGGK